MTAKRKPPTKTELNAKIRELKQNVKILTKELNDLKNGTISESKLPLVASSFYKQGELYYVDILAYSPESNNVSLKTQIVEKSKELALHKFDMVTAEMMDQQENLNV